MQPDTYLDYWCSFIDDDTFGATVQTFNNLQNQVVTDLWVYLESSKDQHPEGGQVIRNLSLPDLERIARGVKHAIEFIVSISPLEATNAK